MAAALLSMRAAARCAGTSQRWYSAAVKTANLDTRLPISNETRKKDLLDLVPLKQGSSELAPKQTESTAISEEDREIDDLIRQIATATDLESPRLYGSFGVGKPLVGELAPIRPREHKYVYPLNAQDQPFYKAASTQRPRLTTMIWLQRKRDFTLRGLRLWMKRVDLRRQRRDQTYSAERVGFLGPELAAAHFFVYRGARVKFQGVDKWFSLKEGNAKSMPDRHMSEANLEAIDAAGLPLMYEGMDHFIGLRTLKYLSLKNCPNIDDWCLPKLFILNKTLEYLDLSGCRGVSERGIASLYHLSNLRTLVLDKMPNVQNKELVALLLEDELPLCEIEGVEYNQPPPILQSPLERSVQEEEEWTRKKVPLFHRIALPDYPEVGNKEYNIAYEKEREQRSLRPPPPP